MNLIVNVFYNDGVFTEILKYFKLRKLSAWEWLSIIYDGYANFKRFGEFTDKFVAETEGELWNSVGELMNFCGSPANIQKVIDGEIGGNLMYNYKGLSMTKYLDAVAEVAKLASTELLQRHGLEHDIQFVTDIVDFNYLRMREIFVDEPETYTQSFAYDILTFSEEPRPVNVEDYRFSEPRPFEFVFTDEQKHMLSGFIKLFGTNTTGVSRTLSRVYIRKLLREPHQLGADRGVQPTTNKGFMVGETNMTGLNEFS